MRAQHMPKPFDHSWPAGMNMAVGVIRAVTSPLIAHNAQNARRTGLQHINNNHPDATAKDPQHTIFRSRTEGPAARWRAGPLAEFCRGSGG